MWLCGDDAVQVVVETFLFISSLNVLENGSLGVLLDFDKVLAVLNAYTLTFQFLLDPGVSAVVELHEFIIGVHDSEGSLWIQFAVSLVPSPDFG